MNLKIPRRNSIKFYWISDLEVSLNFNSKSILNLKKFLGRNLFLSSNPSKQYFILIFSIVERSFLDWSKFEWVLIRIQICLNSFWPGFDPVDPHCSLDPTRQIYPPPIPLLSPRTHVAGPLQLECTPYRPPFPPARGATIATPPAFSPTLPAIKGTEHPLHRFSSHAPGSSCRSSHTTSIMCPRCRNRSPLAVAGH
jgi:hypothetical protein